nr:hypothetical protein [Hymenobacter siberiensis]
MMGTRIAVQDILVGWLRT